VSMTGKIEHVEVITSVRRRRRWSAEGKAAIVQETYAPGMSVSLVARRYGIAPNQLFTWRRLYASGGLSAVGAEKSVAVSEYRALLHQVRELQRLLGKTTLENEILREALNLVRAPSPARMANPSRDAVTRMIAAAFSVQTKNREASARAAPSLGVPAPISSRIRMPRLWPATWTRYRL
jgi:transposase